MKREILFRGKRVDNGKWVYGYYVNKSPYKHQIVTTEEVFPVLVVSETVGQFTGLTDKNGKKIFEGDIISDGYGNAEIKWYNDECQFLAEFNYELSEPQELGNWGIIIGNIYDNPDLVQ